MSETYFIYALCEPGSRTIRYIGKTRNLLRRLSQHLSDSSKAPTHLGRWLNKLLLSGKSPTMVPIRQVSRAESSGVEIEFIRLARGIGMNLVNATDGGDGVTMTEEIRQKLRGPKSAAHREKLRAPKSEAHKQAIRRARLGKPHPHRGHPTSDATREKLRRLKTGRLLSNPPVGVNAHV